MAVILLIDDYDDFRYLLRRLLTLQGHEVFEASDGGAGLDSAREILPDVIVLDLGVPEKDGWKVREELDRTPALSTIPVIALTARHVRPGERGRTVAPFETYLTKPFDLPTFMTALEAALGSRTPAALGLTASADA